MSEVRGQEDISFLQWATAYRLVQFWVVSKPAKYVRRKGLHLQKALPEVGAQRTPAVASK